MGVTQDEAIKQFFKQNHENLKKSIDILCEDWETQLESGGLKRIYVDGYVYYVSEFYFNQVDNIEGYLAE